MVCGCMRFRWCLKLLVVGRINVVLVQFELLLMFVNLEVQDLVQLDGVQIQSGLCLACSTSPGLQQFLLTKRILA